MPELLTREPSEGGRLAAFKSEWWPASARNGGRLHVGKHGRIESEFADVNDYRYLSSGARFGFGVMTGNAYVDADIRLRDLKTGEPLG